MQSKQFNFIILVIWHTPVHIQYNCNYLKLGSYATTSDHCSFR